MKSFDYVIKDPVGMHARPAAVLAKISKRIHDGCNYYGKWKECGCVTAYACHGNGNKNGHKINVTIEGAKEEEAEEKLKEFFESRL